MKRYWLFGDCEYYPTGGLYDFIKSFDTLEEAVQYAKERERTTLEWWHILDAIEQRIAAGGEGRPCYAPEELPTLEDQD